MLTNELSRRAACKQYGLGWHTLTKILAYDEPPGDRKSQPRAKPKIDESLPVIHQILVDDRQAPKKQRHTAWRIFERRAPEKQRPGPLHATKRFALAESLVPGSDFIRRLPKIPWR